MPAAKSYVTPLDYEKMTPEEREWAVLTGRADLDRAMKEGTPRSTTPPASPPAQPSADYAVVGKPQKDLEGYRIVTGKSTYTVDVYLPDMLYVRVLRSPLPHAKITSIDTSKAAALPGVYGIITYKDIPAQVLAGLKPVMASEPALVGDPIAAVAAVDETVAEDALNLINVQYQQLPFIVDPIAGAKSGAPLALSNLQSNVSGPDFKVVRGDVNQGFASADVTVEHTVNTQDQQHVALEPHIAVARWDNDVLTMWTSSQYTHAIARIVAATLGMPYSKVRVIAAFTGGGFGDKTAVYPYHLVAALLAKKTMRPVRYELTRLDVFYEGSHHFQVVQDIKLGFKKDGTLVALQADSTARLGAYSRGSGLAGDTLSGARLEYNIPNILLNGRGVITNTSSAGARRSVGEASGMFALETLMDVAAEKLGMDPVDLRLKNINETGDPESKLPWTSNGLRDCITNGASAFNWKSRWQGWANVNKGAGPLKTGVGFMALASNKGSKSPPMTAVVEINVDGSVRVVQGAAHIGGPQRTTFAIIAAETLGANLDQLSVSEPDTAFTTDTGIVAGSRATKSVGSAVKAAAEDARAQLLGYAAAKFSKDLSRTVNPQDLAVTNGQISLQTDSSVKPITFADAVNSGFIIVDGQQVPAAATIIGRAVVPPVTQYAQQTYAAAFYEVQVNVQTGVVRVTDAMQIHDVGKVINPLQLTNQVHGGSVQGTGFALTEDYIYDTATGIPVSSNLDDYKMLMINDVPKITALFVESNDAVGPFGAKGIGEPAFMAAAAAISNAIYYAAGIRLTSLPMNPKRVLEALKA